jgi:hypothetical protein
MPIAYADDPTMSSAGAALARTDAAGAMFHSLFQTGERREAVAPAISELWRGVPRQGMPQATNASGDQTATSGAMLNLFRDTR